MVVLSQLFLDNECSNKSTPDNHIEDLKTMMEEMKKSIIHEVNVAIDNKLQSQKEVIYIIANDNTEKKDSATVMNTMIIYTSVYYINV